MQKSSQNFQSHVLEKGLIVGKYKGLHQAKRIMMKAGLPVEIVNKAISQERNKITSVDK